MSELAFSSATQLLRAMAEGRVSAGELLEHYIARHDRFNPALNAIVATDFDHARDLARAADAARASGQPLGPLHGLPMTAKDNVDVVGMPCTFGSPAFREYMPTKNAGAAQALTNAGAIIFGKTNLPLFGKDLQSYNEVYGQTNNPWDVTRVPGGSSGGSAAALAAGLTGLEIGSDIGGSIRTPAGFCGVYGHKPSWNTVSLRGMLPPTPGGNPQDYPFEVDLLVAGPLARSADDLELALDIIAGPSPSAGTAYRLSFPKPRKDKLADFKVGLWLDDATCPVERSVGDALQAMADSLARAGVNVRQAQPDIDFRQSNSVYLQLLNAATSSSLPDDMYYFTRGAAPYLDKADQSPRATWIRASAMAHRDWLRLNYQRQLIRQKWGDFFQEFDVLLCPVAPVTAFCHDHSYIMTRTLSVNGKPSPYVPTLLAWAGLATLAYLPSTSVPIGLASDGLPVGMQIIGPYLEDRTCLQFAKLLDELTGGFRPPAGYESM